ncbi:hypothetical protein [Luteolibacter soli]
MAGSLAAGLTEDQVMKCLQSVTLASNSCKAEACLETMPTAGFELVLVETKERQHIDRAQMKEIIESFYRSIDTATYVYGLAIESISLAADGSASVEMRVSEVFRDKESGELRSRRYREKLTMVEEKGRVVITRSEMDAAQTTKLAGPGK